MNNIKRISLMTAIFLTVALASSAVEAGVIQINGTIAGSESYAAFPGEDTGASRLIVGDAANGDSILTCLIGNNPDLCANGDLHIVELATIMGGTGRYAHARGAFTVDRCVNFATGETSGTISGTLIVRGNP